MFLANGLSTFFINGKPVFDNGPKRLPRNSPDFSSLDSWVFENYILAYEFFAKVLYIFKFNYQLVIICVEN